MDIRKDKLQPLLSDVWMFQKARQRYLEEHSIFPSRKSITFRHFSTPSVCVHCSDITSMRNSDWPVLALSFSDIDWGRIATSVNDLI